MTSCAIFGRNFVLSLLDSNGRAIFDTSDDRKIGESLPISSDSPFQAVAPLSCGGGRVWTSMYRRVDAAWAQANTTGKVPARQLQRCEKNATFLKNRTGGTFSRMIKTRRVVGLSDGVARWSQKRGGVYGKYQVLGTVSTLGHKAPLSTVWLTLVWGWFWFAHLSMHCSISEKAIEIQSIRLQLAASHGSPHVALAFGRLELPDCDRDGAFEQPWQYL